MRGPMQRLAQERLPGIGHNGGPSLDRGQRYRAHCWKVARKALVPHLPLEVVRRRVARARELGLEYPAYASILLGTGRDIVAFLFTADALRLEQGPPPAIPAPEAPKLRALTRCDRLLIAGKIDLETLGKATEIRFTDRLDPPPPGWAAAREALSGLARRTGLPPDGVVLVGASAEERGWAEAGRLARFLPADRYFGPR